MPQTPLTPPDDPDRRASYESSRSKLSAKRPSIDFNDATVRRGTRACDVLKNMGSIWKNCKGSAETFNLSEAVNDLNVFISHNWSTPRPGKFLALTLHFNFARAVGVAAVASTVLGSLMVLGFLPRLSHWGNYTYVAPYSIVAAYVFPSATLLGAHEFVCRLKCLKSCDRRVFLDKTCIHQTNKELQRRGLNDLTAFLNASDEILVVYSDVYLRRLWTVYELVSVIVIRQAPKIKVVTPAFASLVFLWWFGFFVSCFLYMLMYSKEVQEGIRDMLVLDGMLLGGMSPMFLLFVCNLRQWAKERSRMLSDVKNFSIHSAECTVAEDRRTVYRNISIIMRDFGFVDSAASEDDALDSFNALARDLIPPHLDASFGLVGIPYRHIVLMCSPLLAMGVDNLTANASIRPGARWFLAEATWYAAESCVVLPLWLALCCWVTSWGVQLRRPQEVLFIGFSCPLLLIVHWAMRQITFWLYSWGIASWPGFLADLLVVGFSGLLVYFVYRHRRVRSHVQMRWKEQWNNGPELCPGESSSQLAEAPGHIRFEESLSSGSVLSI